jgi:hypothetical protein
MNAGNGNFVTLGSQRQIRKTEFEASSAEEEGVLSRFGLGFPKSLSAVLAADPLHLEVGFFRPDVPISIPGKISACSVVLQRNPKNQEFYPTERDETAWVLHH